MDKALRRKLVIGFALGLIVFVGLLLYGDVQEMSRLLKDFQWFLLPLLLALTALNYVLRGFRFHPQTRL